MQENSSSKEGEQQKGGGGGDHQPVRSRWTPKPEQILILESIFNRGMVNPPKEETVRIRKLLEKFGPVGDANVFYWFQNRRSRSRRRQRQMQATLLQQQQQQHHYSSSSPTSTASIQSYQAADLSCHNIGFANSAACGGFAAYNNSAVSPSSYDHLMLGGSSSSSSSSSCGVHQDGVESIYSSSSFYDHQLGMEAPGVGVTSILCPSSHPPASTDHLHHHPTGGGYSSSSSSSMTVFINGVGTEVPRGPLDMRAMFGTEDVVLLHSSGLPLPINEYGFTMQCLQPGESYFLVSRPE